MLLWFVLAWAVIGSLGDRVSRVVKPRGGRVSARSNLRGTAVGDVPNVWAVQGAVGG